MTTILTTLIVFSERAYHTIYADPFSWSNIIQLYTLKENTCLFIGLSITDPNMRRLLDISTRKNNKKIKHYAFMQRSTYDDIEDILNELEIYEDSNRSKYYSFVDAYYKLKEKNLQEFGINIIWYEDNSEIPELLKLIYQ